MQKGQVIQPASTNNKCGECRMTFKNAHGLKVHYCRVHGPNKVGKKHKVEKLSVSKNNITEAPSFCPRCGCNMKAVAMALSLVK